MVTTEPSSVHTPESIWNVGAAFANAYQEWLRAHSVNPNHTFRVEHYADSHIVVYQFDINDAGKTYLDLSTGDLAEQEPFRVDARSVPPDPTDYQ